MKQNQSRRLRLDNQSLPPIPIPLGEVSAMTSMQVVRAYQQGELEMRGCPVCSLKQNCRKELANENITIRDYSERPLFLNAEIIAKVLGISPVSSYELMHESGFPVLKIGNRMVVPKGKFICWVEENTTGEKPL